MHASDRLRSMMSRPTDWRARFPELSRIDAERARGGSPVRPKAPIQRPPASPLVLVSVRAPSASSPVALALLARAPLVRSRMRRVIQNDRATTGRVVAEAPQVSVVPSCDVPPVLPAVDPKLVVSSTIVSVAPAVLSDSLETALQELEHFRAGQTNPDVIRASDDLKAALFATTKAHARLPFWMPTSAAGRRQVSRWRRPISWALMLLLVGVLALVVLSEAAGARGFWGSCGLLLGSTLLLWGRSDRLTGLTFSDRLPLYRQVSLCKSGLLSPYQAVSRAVVRWCDNPRATQRSVLRLSRSLEQLLAAAAAAQAG